MSSLTYRDENNPLAERRLSKLVSGYLEPVSPDDAIRDTCGLVKLLLLSNHVDHARALLYLLYKHFDAMSPPRGHADRRQEPVFLPAFSQSVEHFWVAHWTMHPPPENSGLGTAMNEQQQQQQLKQQRIALAMRDKYFECCRTGWMLEHCGLPEPANPRAAWQATDDPAMLAMCCRLLAKNNLYPRDRKRNPFQRAFTPRGEGIVQALLVAKKLFALPEEPVDWERRVYDPLAPKRHASLLYRRLGIELAIRGGELETAAGFLSDGLVRDGFMDGGMLDNYLFVPGIYDVLPLLARRGKGGNPFYIEEADAVTIVAELKSAIELRATKGRQWSLAPEKVGWRELLHRLAEGAWKVNEEEYLAAGVNSAAEILFPPASEKEIKAAEEKVGPLPPDFREMVSIANGFQGGNHLFGGGICGIRDINLGYDGGLALEDDIEGIGISDFDPQKLPDAIQLAAGHEDCDGYSHYYIPPAGWKACQRGEDLTEGGYLYWHSASWAAGGCGSWPSIRDWVASCVEEVEAMVERGEKCE